MRQLRRFFARLVAWTTTRSDEARLQAEIDEHLTLLTEENMRAGFDLPEARRQARLTFSGIEATKERYRDQRTFTSVETLIQDIRHAWRRLIRAPAFTAATLLTLALGIGATTSIFSIVHAVLLASLPVPNPGELYRLGRQARCCYIGGYTQDKEFSLVSYELYEYLRDHTQGFRELAAFPASQPLFGVRRAGDANAAQSEPGEFVSGNYFAMFGIRAYAGRLLTPADDRGGAAPVAVLSYRIWQEQYGADLSVIGRVFMFNAKPFTIVGVTPPGFFGDTLRTMSPDVYLPLGTEPLVEGGSDLRKYDTHWLELIGRIRPGVQPAALEAQMRVALRQWLQSHWGEMSAAERAQYPEQTLFLTPGGSGITSTRQQYGESLFILMTVTGFVLLIVCANVASLMVVRGIERQRQTSVSIALSARVSRVIRQPLIESLLLSLAGGAAGLVIAFAGTRLLLKLAFPTLPGFAAVPIDASPSSPVLLFAFTISLLTGVFFGMVPAWMAARVDPVEALRSSPRVTASAGSLPRKALVAVQAALSLTLLICAGLLSAALQHLEHQQLGFEPDRRLVVKMNPMLAGYTPERLPALYTRIHDAVEAVPGVAGVALSLVAPPAGGWGTSVWIDGHPTPDLEDTNVSSWNRVTAGYFGVVGTRIVAGRAISERDTARSPKVAVVSESFARKFFRSENAIGKYFGPARTASHEFEIVGVAADARYSSGSVDGPTGPMYFLAETQADYTRTDLGSLFLQNVVIATKPGARVAEASIRRAMASAEPDLPITFIRTLRDAVAGQFTQARLIARLTSFFGILSLALASIGVYGVAAHNTRSRVGEIGLRIALGATSGRIVRLVSRSALVPVFVGILAGLPLTFGGARLLRSQLYGTNSFNPFVVVAAVLLLGFSALVASCLPAVRASMTPPSDALRAE